MQSDAACRSGLPGPTYLADVMICAGGTSGRREGHLPGRQRGPLVLAVLVDIRLLAGITSFGDGCAPGQTPRRAYTQASSPEIQQLIGASAPAAPPPAR